ncbi:MAG: hypothetical protein PHC69_06335 [Ruminiclostridium sp.]|nr:hypothetical protein [Ruminiclostridium sp.]
MRILIDMVEEFNKAIIEKYLAMDIDIMLYPEDLGVPLENIKAVMDAMEKYVFYFN